MRDSEPDHETDDGPSLDDLNRFGRDTGYCPHCGAEVYDQAMFCPQCTRPIEGNVRSEHPSRSREFDAKWIAVVAIFIVLGLLGWAVF